MEIIVNKKYIALTKDEYTTLIKCAELLHSISKEMKNDNYLDCECIVVSKSRLNDVYSILDGIGCSDSIEIR